MAYNDKKGTSIMFEFNAFLAISLTVAAVLIIGITGLAIMVQDAFEN